MKIAVIGGNLLGCATTLDLALVEEHDKRVFASSSTHAVTLFDRLPSLGGHSFRSVHIGPSLRVEVGGYRSLPLPPGSFLSDLVAAANDARGTVSILGRVFAIPGAVAARRGRARAVVLRRPWDRGTHARLIRSFAAWDWRDDAYHFHHKGWSMLDLLYRFLDNAIWRSLTLAALLWSVTKLNQTRGTVPRAVVLAQCLVLLAVFLFSPKDVVRSWQRNYSFWGTTLPTLWEYGITPAISRGSTIGFVKMLRDMNEKNVATCSASVSTLVKRAGIEAYIRGSGEDYTRIFKYNTDFVQRFLAPVVGWQYGGAKLSEISSLASHFAMLDADFSNSDAAERLQVVTPENASLCTALVDAARSTMEVNVKLDTQVTDILYDEESKNYKVVYGDSESELFEGVVLCASPREGEMTIETPLGTTISELLGYDRDTEAADEHASQEAEYVASQSTEGVAQVEAAVSPVSCSHLAVVVGSAKPGFFRFNSEKDIPDLVQISHAPGVSRFERIRESSNESPGVYTVLCGADFQSGGLFEEIFEEGADLKHLEAVPKSVYKHNPIPTDKDVDDCFPNIVLGNRFIYAAATDKCAKHPEMDAISAVNAASLLSEAIKWSLVDAEGDGEEEDTIEGRNEEEDDQEREPQSSIGHP